MCNIRVFVAQNLITKITYICFNKTSCGVAQGMRVHGEALISLCIHNGNKVKRGQVVADWNDQSPVETGHDGVLAPPPPAFRITSTSAWSSGDIRPVNCPFSADDLATEINATTVSGSKEDSTYFRLSSVAYINLNNIRHHLFTERSRAIKTTLSFFCPHVFPPPPSPSGL